MSAPDLLLAGLAVFRLTRLVTDDSIFAWLRQRVRPWPGLAEFLGCPWCVSMHIAALVWLGHALLPIAWWRGGAQVLALSAVASLIATNLDR